MKSTGDYGFIRRTCVCLASLAATFSLCVAQADDVPADPVRTFSIVAQPLSKALLEFSKQSGLIVTVPPALVEGKTAPEIHGALSSSQALGKLLSGSGLKASRTPSGGITIGNATTSGQGHTSSSTSQFDPANGQPGRTADPQTATSSDSSLSSSSGSRTESDATKDRLTEIIVTAQKKSERLQDVPVPVTSINAESLIDTNQLRLEDYFTQIPGLSVNPALYGAPRLTIRGVTTGGFTSPTVGVTVDDVPFGASTNLAVGGAVPDIDPSELQRVEVLRGPQGTLYGASSIGGLLKYVTVDPSTAGVSGRVETDANSVYNGSGAGYGFRGALNVPVGDALAVRASAFMRRDPGYIDNPVLGIDGLNEVKVYGGRLSGLWRQSDDFSVKLSALFQRSTSNGSADVEHETVLGTALGDLQQDEIRGTGWFDKKVQAYSAVIRATLGTAELTALSGYSINNFSNSEDFTASWGSNSNLITVLKTSKFTQEIRLTTPIGQKADWLIGLFYNHENSPALQKILCEGRSTGTQCSDPITGAVLPELYAVNFPTTFAEYAVFTDFTYHFTDRFDVQIGGRESQNKQTYNQTFTAPPPNFIVPELDSKDNAFTYLLTPRFILSPDLMIYARFASGYRPGGPNSSLGVPSQYGSDKTENYEIGFKGDVLEHTLSFDTSIYYVDWKNFQLLVQSPAGGPPYFANGSRAVSKGVEISVESRPLQGLTLSGWVAWDDAKLADDLPDTAFNATGKAGDRMPYSARFSGSLSAEQEFHIAANVIGFVGASVSYVGDRVGTFPSSFDPLHLRQDYPAYTRTDLRGGLRYDSWTVSTFANNVTDRRGLLGGGIGGDTPTAFYYIQPRTIGVSISKSF